MEKIKIDCGWANGWKATQEAFFESVKTILENDEKTVKTGRSIGSCCAETTWDNGDISLTWKVDSSD